MGIIRIKRIYAAPQSADGTRVLVDRIWPRGVSKEAAKLDFWCKEIAPSTALRKWFGHDPSRFDEFRAGYRAELDANKDTVTRVRELTDNSDVTLLYAARDPHINHAIVLAEYLDQR